jgi:hypothetical protein
MVDLLTLMQHIACPKGRLINYSRVRIRVKISAFIHIAFIQLQCYRGILVLSNENVTERTYGLPGLYPTCSSSVVGELI